jgi:hypothetical protein
LATEGKKKRGYASEVIFFVAGLVTWTTENESEQRIKTRITPSSNPTTIVLPSSSTASGAHTILVPDAENLISRKINYHNINKTKKISIFAINQ